MVTQIKGWSTTPGNNNSPPPNGAPEGWPPSSVNDVVRQNMAAVRAWYEDASWIDLGNTLTFVDGDTIRISGDVTAIYHANRRIRANGTTPFQIYGTITSSVYSAPNTDVNVTWDSGSVDNTLSAVAVGPQADVPILDIHGIKIPDGSIPVSALATQPVPTGIMSPFMLSTLPTGYIFPFGTIGDASSNGTNRANTDTAALFAGIWADYDNTDAPIFDSAGVASTRGANAAADFAAHKALTVPSPAGCTVFAKDNLGGVTKNILQVSTTITTTSGSPTATVASSAGLYEGMYIVSTNVSAGTTIASISGTTLTLSGNASGTASGTAARFSPMKDAQKLGSTGGALSVTITKNTMPVHEHDIDFVFGNGYVAGGTQVPLSSTTPPPGSVTRTTASTGGGQAHANTPPGFVANFIVKL